MNGIRYSCQEPNAIYELVKSNNTLFTTILILYRLENEIIFCYITWDIIYLHICLYFPVQTFRYKCGNAHLPCAAMVAQLHSFHIEMKLRDHSRKGILGMNQLSCCDGLGYKLRYSILQTKISVFSSSTKSIAN